MLLSYFFTVELRQPQLPVFYRKFYGFFLQCTFNITFMWQINNPLNLKLKPIQINWSNGCWKVSFDVTGIIKNVLKQKTFMLNCNNISQYYYFIQ